MTALSFRRSDWSIAGSSGVTATVGTPVARIQVGGGYLRLPVRNGSSSQSTLLKGFGIGGEVAGAAEFPLSDFINISGSPDFYPSRGIGPIYRRPGDPDRPYVSRDLRGTFLVLAATASANFNGANLCLGFWLKDYVGQCLKDITQCKLNIVATGAALTIVPGGFPLHLLMKTRAVGVFWGLVVTTDVLSAGVSAFQYDLS